MSDALISIGKIENFDRSYKLPLTSQVKFKFFESIATLKIEYYYETRQFDKMMVKFLPIGTLKLF